MSRVLKFRFNSFCENCYLVYNENISDGSKNCVLIDPGYVCTREENDLITNINEKGLVPAAILLTHLHFDHISGVKSFLQKYDIPVYLCAKDRALEDFCINGAAEFAFPSIDCSFTSIDISDGEILSLGGLSIKCIATPGHTIGGFSYLIDDKLFSGDTLFDGTIGRSDLITGEYDDLIRSIMEKLMILDGDIDIFPGHGSTTSIAYERMNNPFLEPFNEPNSDPDDQ